MNAQAVAVERAYRRPIMSAFHGHFSVGSLVGSGLVALTPGSMSAWCRR